MKITQAQPKLCAPAARNALQHGAHRPGGKSVLVTKDGRGDPPTAAPGYNRAICARVLMARGVVPPEDCPYLQCIAANIFRPGELGAQAARERIEAQCSSTVRGRSDKSLGVPAELYSVASKAWCIRR